MSDPLTGIRQIIPTYPGKPARPVKERNVDDLRKRRPEPEPQDAPDGDEPTQTIDEYI